MGYHGVLSISKIHSLNSSVQLHRQLSQQILKEHLNEQNLYSNQCTLPGHVAVKKLPGLYYLQKTQLLLGTYYLLSCNIKG